MDLQIRQCEISDYEAIYKLNKNEMGYDYSKDKTKEKLRQLIESSKDKIYVAIIDGAVVGYVHANDYDVIYAPHMKNIMGIAVLKEYRKLGIGKELLATVEEWALKTGAYGIRLVSGETRTEAHKFYHHYGYYGDKRQINFKKMF